jgi:hypothetical protein
MMFAALFGTLGACIALAVGVDMLSPAVKSEAEVKRMLPGTVPMLVAIPKIETPLERRQRILFNTVAIAICVLACCAEVVFFWRVHPFL